MGLQRRFQHLVIRDKESGHYKVRPGAETAFENVQKAVQANIEGLHKIAELDI